MCRLSDLLKPKRIEPLPIIQVFKEPASTVQQRLSTLGVKPLYGLLDSEYYLTSFEDWGKIFHYIYMIIQPPKYQTNRWNCEDFAIWLKAMVSFYFGLNWFALVIGDVPAGRHGWNLFFDGQDIWQYEPQWVNEGEPFKIGERGCTPLYTFL